MNGLIGPVVKTLSIPLSMLTMGLAGILVNAGVLLLGAFSPPRASTCRSATSRQTLLSVDTIVAAIIGAIVISLVSRRAVVIPD